MGIRQSINLWLPDELVDWHPGMQDLSADLAFLTAYKLKINWEAKLTIIATVPDRRKKKLAKKNLQDLITMTRIPVDEVIVVRKAFDKYFATSPQSDLDIFKLGPDTDFAFVEASMKKTRSACLYCMDSGQESMLA